MKFASPIFFTFASTLLTKVQILYNVKKNIYGFIGEFSCYVAAA